MKKRMIPFLMACVFNSTAQTGTGLWTAATVSKKLNDKFGIAATGQLRATENISYIQTYLIETGLSYKLSKGLDLSVNYRFSNRRKDLYAFFNQRHRFYVDLEYGKKISHFKIENRVRYQHQFKDNDGELGFDASYLRNKLELSIPNKTPFTPSISGDLFYEVGGSVDQIRPKAAVNYKFSKKHAFEVGMLKNIDLLGIETNGIILSAVYKLKF